MKACDACGREVEVRVAVRKWLLANRLDRRRWVCLDCIDSEETAALAEKEVQE